MSNHNDSLQEGLGYTIHLFDGRRILYAVYHHCAASGQHYFAKGDKVYPIESVFRHSMQGVVVREDMPPLVLTGTYFGHRIEVTFTSIIPYNLFTQVPDDVLDSVGKDLKKNMVSGTFSDDHTGDMVTPADGSGDVYTTFAGSWRIVELQFELMSRIAMWWNNGYSAGEFDCASFIRHFGEKTGRKYYDRWVNHCKENLLDMFGTLVSEQEDGQLFCDMVMQQVELYEKREEERHG